jgi:hypothetical protein
MSSGDDVTADFLARVPSFSLIYFAGDVYEHMPALLIRCGYSIIAESSERGSFFEIVDALGTVQDQTIVQKAAYPVTGGTVLLDPEMVVGVSPPSTLMPFCAERGVEAVVAIWERVSESVIAKHLTGRGVLMDTCTVAGQPQKPLIDPPRQLTEQPDPYGLRAYLAAVGAPVDEVFGVISVRAFELNETSWERK